MISEGEREIIRAMSVSVEQRLAKMAFHELCTTLQATLQEGESVDALAADPVVRSQVTLALERSRVAYKGCQDETPEDLLKDALALVGEVRVWQD